MTLADGSRAVSDETIQALCRWATPESLKTYARINRSDYAKLLKDAASVRFDSIQAATLWKHSPVIDDDAKFGFIEALQQHMAHESVA